MPNRAGFRPAPSFKRPTSSSTRTYAKSGSSTGGSARGRAGKPERKMSMKAYAAALRKMTAQAADKAMSSYAGKGYNTIKGVLDKVDGHVTLSDGSKVSSHMKIMAQGKLQEGIAHVTRKFSTKGSTETAAGADAVALPTTASLWRSQRGLPVGSTITETCRIGRPSIPRGRGFNPVKVTTYKSDQRSTSGTGHQLEKAPAFKAKNVGINEIYTKLIPLEPSEINMRRLSLMFHPNYLASHQTSDTRIREFWDSPTLGDDDLQPTAQVAGARSSYFPFDLSAKLRYVNLNEVLTSKIKITIVQLKGPNTYGQTTNAAQTYFPREELNIALDAMPPQDKISSEASPLKANAYGTDAGGGDAGTQHCWGYNSSEFVNKYGSYDFYSRKSIKTSPRYSDSFNEIYSTGFVNVGAGSAYVLENLHHINRNFTKLGNLNKVSAQNSWTSPALYMLCEVKGRPSTEYYRAIKKSSAPLERLFSSGTGPVAFGWEFETGFEFTSVDQPITESVTANLEGLPYKKSYMLIDNEIDVSEIINEPYSTIVAAESDIPEPVGPSGEESRIIVPVIKSTNMQGSTIRSVKV